MQCLRDIFLDIRAKSYLYLQLFILKASELYTSYSTLNTTLMTAHFEIWILTYRQWHLQLIYSLFIIEVLVYMYTVVP